MNAARRKSIEEAITKIEDAKAVLEQAQQEEQDYYDNMPESLQGGEKGDAAQTAADNLQTAVDDLDNVISTAQEAIQQ